MTEANLPRGYIYSGPFMYHHNPPPRDTSYWLMWDGEKWIRFDSDEAKRIVEELECAS